MKVGDLVKFKEGNGWESVGLVIAMCHIDMFKILWATPCERDSLGCSWLPLDHLEVLNESR